MYLEIANTGNVSLLNAEDNMTAWESIVEKNCKVNGADEYSQYVSLSKSYALTVNEYIGVNAAINKLAFIVDYDLVDWLVKKGYKIETGNGKKDFNLVYAESLAKAQRKAANLMTRINMKKSELIRMSKPGKQDGRTLEEILATVSYAIGFTISEDVTLARFNEYNRILRVRAEQEKQHGRIK